MVRRLGQGCAFLAFFCSLVLGPAAATAQTTALFFDSQPGDYIGGGVTRTVAPPQATFSALRFDGGVAVSVDGPTSGDWWDLSFSAGQSSPLGPGSYFGATRRAFTESTGLDVGGSGRGCNQLTGRFVVLEAEYAPDGRVLRFAADFEQHCEDADAALFGAVRVNSTISDMRPFGGSYPAYRLTLIPPVNGVVTGTGLSCGAGQTACEVAYPSVTLTSLTATPDPGFIFTGWTGGCYGGADAPVRVNTVLQCGATFGPQVPTSPRTLLFWDSLPGDVVGLGERHVMSNANSTWSAAPWGSGGVRFIIRGRQRASDLRITAEIQPPNGTTLSPGLTAPITLNPFGDSAGVCISADSRFCSTVSGTIRIFDISLAPDGTPLRFAADIEQHGQAGKPGLFVAIRYNSEVEHTVPFFGAYPHFALTITPPANGRVISPQGISCGGGTNSCHLTFASPTSVPLSAMADAGFAFAGWTGACRSALVDITVAVDSDKVCSPVFVPIVPTGPRTLAVIESQAGDTVGGGTKRVFSAANSVWQVVEYNGRNAVEFNIESIDSRGSWSRWSVDLKAPDGQVLAPGLYAPATRAAFTTGAGLDVSGDGGGCNTLSGRFVVLDIGYGQDGVLTRFAADVEQHCDDRAPGLFVAIRYHSLAAGTRPFGGAFPEFQLTVSPPSHGRIVGGGLACGAGLSVCSVAFGAAIAATLTALPDPGFIFTGWTGACTGGLTTTINVSMVKSCGATFGPARPTAPATLLYWESTVGDVLGQGESHVYSPANSQWVASAGNGGNVIQVQVRGPGFAGEPLWTLTFRAPSGTTLAPGAYTFAAGSSAGAAGLEISGNGRACSGSGTFIIRELRLAGFAVTNFAADLEHRCDPSSAALRGRLRLNSMIPVIFPRRPADFDGDGLADTGLFRPSDGTWYIRTASGNAWGIRWGAGTDLPAAGDYDGDGRTDIAVFRQSDRTWYFVLSRTGAAAGLMFGAKTHLPVPGDYDGDGRDDVAVFNPASGAWSIQRSSFGLTSVLWGAGLDRPAPADYDGDGRTDVAVFRPSDGTWYVINSASGKAAGVRWGSAIDVPVAADYDGDGRADIAVFRPSDGTWYIIQSSTNTAYGVQWGGGADVAVPADYDGDGRADIAVFRPSNGTWYFMSSATGQTRGLRWGAGADIPAR